MTKWLAIGDARTRALDIRMAHDLRASRQSPVPLMHPPTSGMLVSRDVAPNATLGLSFGNMSRGKKAGAYVGINAGHGRSHRPAVTFVLHF
jgi:hypothetical protein